MENEKELLDKLKKRIAISNFDAEYEQEQKHRRVFPKDILEEGRKCIMNKRIILNVASALAVVLVLFGVSASIYAKMQWEIGFKEYQEREYATELVTVKNAEETGYTENLEMDYVVQDGIGVKLNSLLMTDKYIEITADFKFPEDMEINTETFCFGFAVYDEEKNLYAVTPRMNAYSGPKGKFDTYTPYMYKEIGIDYPGYISFLVSSSGQHAISAENHSIKSKIELTAMDVFPESKKLYVRINDLGFTMVDVSCDPNVENYTEDFDVSDAEWIFKIDIP